MKLVPVIKPKMVAKRLRKPYTFYLWPGISCGEVTHHYFCEGSGVQTRSISQSGAYEDWLQKQENHWFKRLFGAPRYRIAMVEAPEPSLYVEAEPEKKQTNNDALQAYLTGSYNMQAGQNSNSNPYLSSWGQQSMNPWVSKGFQ